MLKLHLPVLFDSLIEDQHHLRLSSHTMSMHDNFVALAGLTWLKGDETVENFKQKSIHVCMWLLAVPR